VRGQMSQGSYEVVKYEVADGVATVTLNNPEKRNMLSAQMLTELVDAMKRARDDEQARAVVLTGAGDKAFCAGADLGGFAADLPLVAKHFASDLFLEFFRLMPRLGKPSLCAANGHVLAGGMGLALSCDLLIAKEGATFGTPEINVGAFPYMIMAIIYRNVPRKKVNEMMLLGERLSAEQAVEYGLANKVVPADGFDAAVADWAGKLASKSPVLMRLGHDAMYRQQDMAVDDALDYLRSQLSLTFSTEDILEGVTAFFEKRDPEWKGR
jgi:enoyl-CoA hydratase